MCCTVGAKHCEVHNTKERHHTSMYILPRWCVAHSKTRLETKGKSSPLNARPVGCRCLARLTYSLNFRTHTHTPRALTPLLLLEEGSDGNVQRMESDRLHTHKNTPHPNPLHTREAVSLQHCDSTTSDTYRHSGVTKCVHASADVGRTATAHLTVSV